MSAKFDELLTISDNYICQCIRKNFYINLGYSKKYIGAWYTQVIYPYIFEDAWGRIIIEVRTLKKYLIGWKVGFSYRKVSFPDWKADFSTDARARDSDLFLGEFCHSRFLCENSVFFSTFNQIRQGIVKRLILSFNVTILCRSPDFILIVRTWEFWYYI